MTENDVLLLARMKEEDVRSELARLFIRPIDRKIAQEVVLDLRNHLRVVNDDNVAVED